MSWGIEASIWGMLYKEVTLELNLKEWLGVDQVGWGRVVQVNYMVCIKEI